MSGWLKLIAMTKTVDELQVELDPMPGQSWIDKTLSAFANQAISVDHDAVTKKTTCKQYLMTQGHINRRVILVVQMIRSKATFSVYTRRGIVSLNNGR